MSDVHRALWKVLLRSPEWESSQVSGPEVTQEQPAGACPLGAGGGGYVTTTILENEKSVTHCIVHRIIFAVPQQKDNPPFPKSLSSLSDFQFKADQNFSKQNVLQCL